MQQFAGKIKSQVEEIKSSLWFIPAVLVTFVVLLSFGSLWVDRTYTDVIVEQAPWLFGGTASSAQDILSTIASAVITVVSIAFSLTIIAMQQASAQYTPRILRNFTSDRGNQLVLGTYIATFVYALMVLRAVRESEDGVIGFVPSVSVGVAVLLVLVCIGLLIYFINHIASSLQASTVISRVHRDLIDQIDNLYPEQIGAAVGRSKRTSTAKNIKDYPVYSQTSGFVTKIDEDSLKNLDLNKLRELHLLPKVGDFVANGELIAIARGVRKLPTEAHESIRAVILTTNQRSVAQDPLFAVRQLVDTALKGLSPGINDMTTSNYCVRYLGDALGILANRTFPSSARSFPENNLTVHLNRPTWDEFIHESFSQIIQNSKDQGQVIEEYLHTLQRLAQQLPSRARAKPIELLLKDVDEILTGKQLAVSSKKRIRKLLRSLRTALRAVPTR